MDGECRTWHRGGCGPRVRVSRTQSRLLRHRSAQVKRAWFPPEVLRPSGGGRRSGSGSPTTSFPSWTDRKRAGGFETARDIPDRAHRFTQRRQFSRTVNREQPLRHARSSFEPSNGDLSCGCPRAVGPTGRQHTLFRRLSGQSWTLAITFGRCRFRRREEACDLARKVVRHLLGQVVPDSWVGRGGRPPTRPDRSGSPYSAEVVARRPEDQCRAGDAATATRSASSWPRGRPQPCPVVLEHRAHHVRVGDRLDGVGVVLRSHRSLPGRPRTRPRGRR